VSDYERLERDSERPRVVHDFGDRWEKLVPLAKAPATVRERVDALCIAKRITRAALETQEPRIDFRGKGPDVYLAWAYRGRLNGRRAVTAIKYRDLGSGARSAEPGSVYLEPMIIGELRSTDWFVAEGETDAARLHDLVGRAAAIVCLPAGALTFKPKWADMIPRGATVYLGHDADAEGDKGAEKAARTIAGRTVRIRPPEAKDWCEWDGDREAFVALVVAAAKAERSQGDEASDPTVTFAEFVANRDENAAEPLIATAEEGTILPPGGLAILSAKTGDGKTTWTVELVLHASAGTDYLGLSFPRPLRVLVIENEGPREAFREKLEARLATWTGGGEPRIWDTPASWGQIRISDPLIRARLRAAVEAHAVDLVVSDTLTRFGVRGNGTPEETREFVEWLTELGLGRDVAFLLLHHPRTRPEQGESELEMLAGAWPPHADVILLLQRLGAGRARLSYPKTRWALGQRPASILAFDPESESFSYVADNVAEERDLVAELAELMAEGGLWTVSQLRKPKAKGGVGARKKAIEDALAHERFDSVPGKRKDSTYFLLRQESPEAGDARDSYSPTGQSRGRVTESPLKREPISGDSSLDPSLTHGDGRDDQLTRDAQEALAGEDGGW
jgi:hypothetical protein